MAFPELPPPSSHSLPPFSYLGEQGITIKAFSSGDNGTATADRRGRRRPAAESSAAEKPPLSAPGQPRRLCSSPLSSLLPQSFFRREARCGSTGCARGLPARLPPPPSCLASRSPARAELMTSERKGARRHFYSTAQSVARPVVHVLPAHMASQLWSFSPPRTVPLWQ